MRATCSFSRRAHHPTNTKTDACYIRGWQIFSDDGAATSLQATVTGFMNKT